MDRPFTRRFSFHQSASRRSGIPYNPCFPVVWSLMAETVSSLRTSRRCRPIIAITPFQMTGLREATRRRYISRGEAPTPWPWRRGGIPSRNPPGTQNTQLRPISGRMVVCLSAPLPDSTDCVAVCSFNQSINVWFRLDYSSKRHLYSSSATSDGGRKRRFKITRSS